MDASMPRLDSPYWFAAKRGGPFDFENFLRRDWHDAIDTAGITKPARICAPPVPHEPDSA